MLKAPDLSTNIYPCQWICRWRALGYHWHHFQVWPLGSCLQCSCLHSSYLYFLSQW